MASDEFMAFASTNVNGTCIAFGTINFGTIDAVQSMWTVQYASPSAATLSGVENGPDLPAGSAFWGKGITFARHGTNCQVLLAIVPYTELSGT